MRRAGLALILLLFTLLTVYNSVLLPIGEASDETDHYQYHRFVARAGHPPLMEAERREAGFKGGLAPLYYWLTAWPVALVGENTQPDIRRVDARPERHIPTDGLGINHVLHTLDEQWPWRGQVLAWHWVRLLSLPMGWVTIIATYALTRRLAPEPASVALGAAAFVAFLPRFVISSAVINDDNLVFALTALLLLVQVIILQSDRRPTPKMMALFGALFGLTLVTKYFSLILIPEILFTLWFAFRKKAVRQPSPIQGRTGKQTLTASDASPPPSLPPSTNSGRSLLGGGAKTSPPEGGNEGGPAALLAFLLALFVTAGLWLIFIAVRFHRIDELGLIAGLAASLGEPQITEGLVGLLSGESVRPVAATYSLLDWFSLLYRSFWFEFGWMRVFAPTWIYVLFTIFAASALIGLIDITWADYKSRRKREAHSPRLKNERLCTTFSPPALVLLLLHLGLFLLVVSARYILSATIDTGQGRHLYPALPVIALFLSVGIHDLRFTIYDLRFTSAVRPYLLPAFLFTIFYLLPALISLVPATFILPHYQTIPVTGAPIEAPAAQQAALQFADGLSFTGFEVEPAAEAGEVLPVTLYWRAEKEAEQDYLVSLCLQDAEARPVACWRGHFADGTYPARAWEAGDTLIDTVFVPIPACHRLADQAYTLHLELWPLDPEAPRAAPGDSPALQQTFSGVTISLRPTSSEHPKASQPADLWHEDQRLSGPAVFGLGSALAQITYAPRAAAPSPAFQNTSAPSAVWRPLPQFDTPLYLPCEDGSSSFAHLSHFIVSPTLSNGAYQSTTAPSLPPVAIQTRDRIFSSITPTLTFSNTLSPLSLQIAEAAPINFAHPAAAVASNSTASVSTANSVPVTPYMLRPTAQLPVAIRWQSQRWMAEPLVIALKLLDKDFAVGGERVATLGDRYPNVLWAPTEVVDETYPLRLQPDVPPGLYRLEIGLLRQDETLPDDYELLPVSDGDTDLGDAIYPAAIRILDPAHGSRPAQPFDAKIGDAIHLTGFEVNPNPSDSPTMISLTLYWQSSAKIPKDYTVFTQLLGPDGQVWAQWDNPPQAGRYPTSAWAENDDVVDRYTLTLREGAPSGEYKLLVGMYDSNTGERLPVIIDGDLQPNHAVPLTTLPVSY